jgi:2,3-bisphosphoglycerate-independent phosphoglycerate mutase
MENEFKQLGNGRIASIIGRYYAMDRDHRWPRIQAAYDLITQGISEFQASSALSGLEMAYARKENDEFVKATAIIPEGKTAVTIKDGDIVVFMNYRSDRARQITRPFIEEDFDGFERSATPKLGAFVSLTEYSKDFDIPTAFPSESITNSFGEFISKIGMRQLRIAETEKYAHVTFFFNGGEEQPFPGEDRILVNSPDVATYDLQPEMSAAEVTEKLCQAIRSGKYDAIICNFANPDMVGHTGNFDAAVKAIECIDKCLKQIITTLIEVGGEALITADHGNAERMQNPETGQPHTAHTSNVVPFIYVGRDATPDESKGSLADIAPTMLYLMGLEAPSNMSGHTLMHLKDDDTE